jgi:hypothetical protein
VYPARSKGKFKHYQEDKQAMPIFIETSMGLIALKSVKAISHVSQENMGDENRTPLGVWKENSSEGIRYCRYTDGVICVSYFNEPEAAVLLLEDGSIVAVNISINERLKPLTV